MASTALDAAQVIVPTSRDEAVEAFGDGSGVTVFGGGTIVMPELNYGRLRPARVLMLRNADLARQLGISGERVRQKRMELGMPKVPRKKRD